MKKDKSARYGRVLWAISVRFPNLTTENRVNMQKEYTLKRAHVVAQSKRIDRWRYRIANDR